MTAMKTSWADTEKTSRRNKITEKGKVNTKKLEELRKRDPLFTDNKMRISV